MKRVHATLLCALLASCGVGGGAGNVGPPNGGNGPTPPPQGHLYLADGKSPLSIVVFPLPLTAASKASAVFVVGGNPGGIAVDAAGRLYVADFANGVQVFTPPIQNAAAPAFFVPVPTNQQDVKIDAQNDLLSIGTSFGAVGSCKVFCRDDQAYMLPAPVSAASTPSYQFRVMSGQLAFVFGAGFDAAGDLWIRRSVGFQNCSIAEFAAPLSAASSAATIINYNCSNGIGLAFDSAGRMYSNGANGIDVFEPPFTGASAVSFTIPAQNPQGIGFDKSGNLYVSSAGSVVEFAPPFSAASKPVVTVPSPTGGATYIAIGP